VSENLNGSGAVLSSCGRYRYLLWRNTKAARVHEQSFKLHHHEPARTITMIMLNPSTADGIQDDPTIRRCISFASRMGATHLFVANLFASRATKPLDLLGFKDPVGAENMRFVRKAVDRADLVVCAWGTQTNSRMRQLMQAQINALAVELKDEELWSFGVTKNGSPRHPLYLPLSVKLQPFSPFDNLMT